MILAIDPGIATAGACAFDHGGDLVDADAFTSKPGKRPRGVTGAWEATDRARRVVEFAHWLEELFTRHGHVDVLVFEAFGIAQSNQAGVLNAAAAGAVLTAAAIFGVGEISQCTPTEWRKAIGFLACEKPRPPSKKQFDHLPKAERKAALRNAAREHRAVVAPLKKLDDEQLYGLVHDAGGDQVELRLVAHGRNRGTVTHAWDSYGIGRWFLRRREQLAGSARSQSTHARAA